MQYAAGMYIAFSCHTCTLLTIFLSSALHYSITKYTTAGQILGQVIKKLVPSVTAGKKALELCEE